MLLLIYAQFVSWRSGDCRIYRNRTAYLCWFFFGLHHFYLGKPFIGMLYWLAGVLSVANVGPFLPLFLLWAFIDLCLIPGMVRAANKRQDRLAELLGAWEDSYHTGNDLGAAQLCHDCPELAPRLQAQIDALKRLLSG